MIPPLVSFDLAKEHLHIISDDLDSDINAKLRLATAIVANHCKVTSIPEEWIIDSNEELDDSPE